MTLDLDKPRSEPLVDDAKTRSPEKQVSSQKSEGGVSRPLDHFAIRNGVEFAGTHIIIDLWGAKPLDDIELMEATLRKAAKVAGATVLHIHLHHFTEGGGISGVAVLAESHISVHTWPERDFAAFDVFMCGDANPEAAVPIFTDALKPEKVNVSEYLRGVNPDHDESLN